MDILRIADGGKSVKFTLNISHHPTAGEALAELDGRGGKKGYDA